MHPSNFGGGIAVVVVLVLVVLACVLLAGRDGEIRKKEEEQRYMQGDCYGTIRAQTGMRRYWVVHDAVPPVQPDLARHTRGRTGSNNR